MARRHHRINIKTETPCQICEPSQFEKGETGVVMLDLSLARHDTRWINNYDYRPDVPVSNGNTIRLYHNLKTRRVGEYIFTTNAVPFNYGKGNNVDPPYLSNYKMTQSNMDKLSGIANVNPDIFVKKVGGIGYAYEEGLRYWDERQNWDIKIPNPNPPSEEKVLIKEAIESELTDTLVGKGKDSTDDPQAHGMLAHWTYKNPQAYYKPIYNIHITKMVVFMETAGIVHSLINDDNGYQQKVFNVVPGRNVLEVNTDVITKNLNAQVGIRIVEGTLKLNKKRINPTTNTAIYFNEAFAKNRIEQWDPGWGIYYKDLYQDSIIDPSWDMVDKTSLLQTIGQIPGMGDNFFESVKNFFWVDNVELQKLGFDNATLIKGENISGLGWFPMGAKHNGGGKEEAIGTGIIMHLKDKQRFNIIESGIGGVPSNVVAFNNNTGAHGAIVYYMKPLTKEELGYTLHIDEANNKIVKVNLPQTSTLPELPKGVLRGLALKYYNKEKDIICMCLTNLKEEEQYILSNINTY